MGPQPRVVRCFRNFRNTRTPSGSKVPRHLNLTGCMFVNKIILRWSLNANRMKFMARFDQNLIWFSTQVCQKHPSIGRPCKAVTATSLDSFDVLEDSGCRVQTEVGTFYSATVSGEGDGAKKGPVTLLVRNGREHHHNYQMANNQFSLCSTVMFSDRSAARLCNSKSSDDGKIPS